MPSRDRLNALLHDIHDLIDSFVLTATEEEAARPILERVDAHLLAMEAAVYADKLPRNVKTFPCKFCGATVFFAEKTTHGKPEGTWCTVVPEPIHFTGFIPDTIELKFLGDHGIVLKQAVGDVHWVGHGKFCNTHAPPDGEDGLLADLWHATQGKHLADGVAGFQKLLHLAEGDT